MPTSIPVALFPGAQGVAVHGAHRVTWARLPRAGISFAFVRCSVGAARELAFAGHVAGARAAGVLVGALCSADVNGAPEPQAAALVRAGAALDLPPVVEAHGASPEWLASFLRVVAASGQACIVKGYAGELPEGAARLTVDHNVREPREPGAFWEVYGEVPQAGPPGACLGVAGALARIVYTGTTLRKVG
ncbi:MAG TPA: hypothetical protein VF316_13775 [Polyangiaceae bacterium]